MKYIIRIALFLVMLTLIITPALGQEDDITLEYPELTIYEFLTAVGTSEAQVGLTTFYTVLSGFATPVFLALLDDPDANITLFAPTDDAFEALFALLGEDSFMSIVQDPDALLQLLFFHVLATEVRGEALVQQLMRSTTGTATVRTFGGQFLDLSTNSETGNLQIQGANLVAYDIVTKNGVIHVVDVVFIPEVRTIPNVFPSNLGVDDEDFYNPFFTFVNMLFIADLIDVLGDYSTWYTVFAPIEFAFDALGEEALTALIESGAIPDILAHHVVVGNVSSVEIVDLLLVGESILGDEVPAWFGGFDDDGALLLNTLNGGTLTIQLYDATGGYTDFTVNGARTLMWDVDAHNGLIHVIDTVLVP